MNEPDLSLAFPIKAKVAYIKFLFLNDRSAHKKPLFKKAIRGSEELDNIYDSAIFYVWTQLDIEKPSNFKLRFTSKRGKIDDVLQVHPFNLGSAYHPDPTTMYQVWEVPITPSTDNALVVAHHYNAFQKGGDEWAAVRTDENTAELRLIADFTSVITKQNKEEELFEEPPTAYLVDLDQKKSKVDSVSNYNKRVFSTVQERVPKGYVLRFDWKTNWNNLAKLKSSYKVFYFDKSFAGKFLPL